MLPPLWAQRGVLSYDKNATPLTEWVKDKHVHRGTAPFKKKPMIDGSMCADELYVGGGAGEIFKIKKN